MILHFANASSHNKMFPRVETDTLLGDANQRNIVMILFEYGHAKDAKNIINANACPPARKTKKMI